MDGHSKESMATLRNMREEIDHVLIGHQDSTGMDCSIDLGYPEGHHCCYTCNRVGAMLAAWRKETSDDPLPTPTPIQFDTPPWIETINRTERKVTAVEELCTEMLREFALRKATGR